MKKRPVRSDSLETKRILLEAAEKLFAQKGIDNTSLLDVLKASKVKNRSALQYHFGNKEGLIREVLKRQAKLLQQRRRQYLDSLENIDTLDIKGITRAIIIPMADLVETKGGIAYLQIHSQLQSSKQYSPIAQRKHLLTEEHDNVLNMLLPHFPGISEQTLSVRFVLADALIFSGLNSYVTHRKEVDKEEYFETLIDTLAALFNPDTLQPE